jgi:hypothetical protein
MARPTGKGAETWDWRISFSDNFVIFAPLADFISNFTFLTRETAREPKSGE